MADNTELAAGTGGDILRTEDKTALSAKVPVTLIDVAGTANSESIIGDAGVFMPCEGAAAHDAAVAGNPLLVGAEFDDTTPDAVDEGDIGRLRISANRNLYTTIRDAAGNERGLNVDASGQIAVTQGGTWNITNISGTISLPTGAATSALQTTGNTSLATIAGAVSGTEMQVDVLTVPAPLNVVGGGTEAAALRVTLANDSTGVISIDDGGGVLSVDWNGTPPPIGAGTEAAALRVTVATDSTGLLSIDDNGGSLTVDNGGTFAVQVDAALPAGTNNIGDVDVATVPAPLSTTGGGTEAAALRVTIANNSTGLVSVDDNGASLTVDNGGTFAVQVDSALPAGTNNIGDVDVLSVIPGTGATNLGKAEDAGHTSGDIGVMALAVQQTADAALAGTTLDYAPLQVDDTGYLKVNVKAGAASGTEYTEDDAAPANPAGGAVALVRQDTPSTLVSANGDIVAQRATNYGAAFCQILDSSGNFIDTFGGSGGTASTDDSAFTAGSGQGTPMMGFATADAVDSGDVGVVGMDVNRNLKVSIEVDNVGIGGGTQYTVDAAAPATPTGNALLTERDDALSTVTPIEGDWQHLFCNARGALWVELDPTNSVSVDDGGGALTVDNAGTFAVQVDAALPAGTNNIGDVDVLTVPAPLSTTGGGTEATALRVTVASDSTGLLSVDDNGGSLTVDNGGTFAVQVDAALPAGTNNIGDVDVLTVVTGTGATNLGKAVDDVAGGTDTGVAVLAIRDDALSALTPAEGDYVQLRVNSTGALHVTGGGGGTEYTVDDAAPAAPTGGTRLMERDDALSTITPIEGDWQHMLCNARGALWVELDPTNTVSVDDNGGSLTVDNGGTFAVQVDAALPAGTNNIGDVDVLTIPAPLNVTGGGTEAAALRVTIANDSTGLLSVDDGGGVLSVDWNGTAPPIGAGTEAAALRVTVATDSTGVLSVDDNAASLTVDTDAGALSVDLGTNNDVQGAAAHDAGVSGNPFLTAGEARTSEGTAVANADVVRLMADLVGKLITQPFAPSDLFWQNDGSKTDTTDLALAAAAGAGIRNYITDIIIANTSSTNTTAILKDGSTEIGRFPVPANGGVVHRFGIPLRTTANTALNIASAAAVTTMYFTASGYTGR